MSGSPISPPADSSTGVTGASQTPSFLGNLEASLTSQFTGSASASADANASAVTAASSPNPAATNPTPAPGPPTGFSLTFVGGSMVSNIIFAIVEIILAYYYLVRSTDSMTSRVSTFALLSIVAAMIIYGSYFIYQGLFGNSTWSGVVTPASGVTTNTSMVVPGATIPVSSGNGGNYGVQWWMFVQDWNTRFGQDKTVITRGGTGQLNPYVFLGSVENTLNVKINVMSGAAGSGSSSAPAPVGSDGSSTDDSFTCKVKDVPLQTWFAVSLSVSGRNVDIYLNGLLVRSCLLPGVPQAPAGDVGVMTNGGYSGNLASLNFYARSLTPSDASAFYSAGPPPSAVAQTSPSTTPKQPYTVKLAVVDTHAQEIKKYTL